MTNETMTHFLFSFILFLRESSCAIKLINHFEENKNEMNVMSHARSFDLFFIRMYFEIELKLRAHGTDACSLFDGRKVEENIFQIQKIAIIFSPKKKNILLEKNFHRRGWLIFPSVLPTRSSSPREDYRNQKLINLLRRK